MGQGLYWTLPASQLPYRTVMTWSPRGQQGGFSERQVPGSSCQLLHRLLLVWELSVETLPKTTIPDGGDPSTEAEPVMWARVRKTSTEATKSLCSLKLLTLPSSGQATAPDSAHLWLQILGTMVWPSLLLRCPTGLTQPQWQPLPSGFARSVRILNCLPPQTVSPWEAAETWLITSN